jgi:glycosyltransferase involved in cell wall biosynthesis
MRYSILIPVYNRPDEVDELLQSLARQSFTDFEVIVVEDGSSQPCADVVRNYGERLSVRYYFKSNSGPGQTRNYAAVHSTGDYLIILDSDTIVPDDYLETVERELRANPVDAFGGPDRAHPSFTTIQKAISYSMTSFFTTGGIRGGRQKLDKFYPRSFNMGVRREVYLALGGFSDMRYGEDIDFSIRIFAGGYSCRLFPDAWVYHKRRTDFGQFFSQVQHSGIARINLYKKYPSSLKLVHLLPALFTLGVLFFLAGSLVCLYSLLPLLVYALLVCADATWRNHSLWVGFYSVAAAYVQLIGYGSGFLSAGWNVCVLRRRNVALH